MLKFIIKLLKALNSNSHPGEIAHAVCLGMLLGFLPKNNIFWFIITVFVLFMRINKGALVLCTLAFSLLAPLLDPLFDTVGYWFLTLPALEPAFVFLLDIPALCCQTRVHTHTRRVLANEYRKEFLHLFDNSRAIEIWVHQIAVI